ncbi:MAG TPA: hypothetical protein DCW74_02805, partial [Alteromonas australica]|nr:hypothetical protein [Alteromonas australica]
MANFKYNYSVDPVTGLPPVPGLEPQTFTPFTPDPALAGIQDFGLAPEELPLFVDLPSEIGAPVTDTSPELRTETTGTTDAGTEGAETTDTETTDTGTTDTGTETDQAKAKGITAAGMATGVGQIAGGIANIAMGARALGDVDIAGAESAVADAYAARPSIGTPSEFFQMQKEAYDQRLVAMRLEDINRGLA